MSYEIYIDEMTAYGPKLGIRLADTKPDGAYSFQGFQEAKRTLLTRLADLADELSEQQRHVQYNQQDIRKLRKREITP